MSTVTSQYFHVDTLEPIAAIYLLAETVTWFRHVKDHSAEMALQEEIRALQEHVSIISAYRGLSLSGKCPQGIRDEVVRYMGSRQMGAYARHGWQDLLPQEIRRWSYRDQYEISEAVARISRRRHLARS